jgi:hypothetical protein
MLSTISPRGITTKRNERHLRPHHARIDQARQPHRASPRKCRPQREPLQRHVHELGRPCGDAAIGFCRVLVVIGVVISTAFSPQACTQPQ